MKTRKQRRKAQKSRSQKRRAKQRRIVREERQRGWDIAAQQATLDRVRIQSQVVITRYGKYVQ